RKTEDGKIGPNAKPELDWTSFTIKIAKKHEKELKIIYLDTNTREKNTKEVFGWIIKKQIKSLNIGSPQESNCSGVYGETFEF
ncbi:30717_t:CDS:2, partial [Gigaspora margarita]